MLSEYDSIVSWFKQCLENEKLVQQLKKIKFIIVDIDGSLTDGNIYYKQEGEGGRRFSMQDGFMTNKAMDAGLVMAFVSGKDNPSAAHRAKVLKVPEDLCIFGMKEKTKAVLSLQEKLGFASDEMVIWGDDVLDAQLKIAAPDRLLVVPKSTPFYVQNFADVVVPKDGGNHAFRLCLDLILYVHKKHLVQDLIDKSVR